MEFVTLSSTIKTIEIVKELIEIGSQLQIVLSIRLLCSLPTIVYATVSNIVHQVSLFPFYTSSLHCCKLGCFAPFLHW